MSAPEAIASRLGAIRERIDAAARRAGRAPSEVKIVGVAKKQSSAVIDAAARAGIRDIGENYVQELVAKQGEVERPEAIAWHFVGRLQRNKAKFLVGRAALIHAVDGEPLAREIGKRASAAGVVQAVLIAVNLGGEAQKSGVPPEELGSLLAVLDELPSVRCDGLMTMPPLPGEAEDSRPYFRRLRELRDHHRTPARPLPELSMGTSADYEVAAEEGATWIRLGTALLGPRP